jgi:hypothetical protein
MYGLIFLVKGRLWRTLRVPFLASGLVSRKKNVSQLPHLDVQCPKLLWRVVLGMRAKPLHEMF